MLQLVKLYPEVPGTSDISVTGLCEDTRRAQPGMVFFAHAGSKQNGLSFMPSAIASGCVAIVVPEKTNPADIPHNIPAHVPVIRVLNTRADLARCARILYPQQPAHVMAVTGTSGKTSVTYFVQQFLNHAGKPAVSIGTIGMCGAATRDESLTTPEAPELHQIMNDIAQKNINCAAIEASSQAIFQHRLDALDLHAGAFTNLSRDHLDYHGTMDDYFSAKARLFSTLLPSNGTAVINIDDPYGPDLQKITAKRNLRTITFGRDQKADLRLVDHTLQAGCQHVVFTGFGKTYTFDTQIAGGFQIMNLLCAMALCTTAGLTLDQMVTDMSSIVPPPGRLESIAGHPNGAYIYVDYAHKPDALLNVLQSLRAHDPRRLSVVFGCGGDRDAGKRPLMGEIAAQHADDITITDDNPRGENPATIRSAILNGAKSANTPAHIHEIANRRTAIETAIKSLQSGDILVIAGKGHEQGQKFADHTEPFDDGAVARDVIAQMKQSACPSSACSSSACSSSQRSQGGAT